MMKIITLLFNICGYFTLPGKCPENVNFQEHFELAEFYGKWYQAYHYASDNRHNNNCSTLELITTPSGIHLNQSRIDRGLYLRYSIAKVEVPIKVAESAKLNVTFVFDNAPRRLRTRRYPFYVLATNNNFFATVYTCEYSPLINKHYIYIWILSRNPTLNDVSKELAMKPLRRLGIDLTKITRDERERSSCTPKYYNDFAVEPTTFRFPVPI